MADADAHAEKVRAHVVVDAAQPVVPAWPPPFLIRTLPGAKSISSCRTMTSPTGTLKKRAAAATEEPESFM